MLLLESYATITTLLRYRFIFVPKVIVFYESAA